jgi:MFS family permease
MLAQLKNLSSHEGFSMLVTARLISNVGNGLSPIALAYGVLSLPGADGSDLSAVMGARYLPLIVFMLFGGVFADRFQRNRIVGGSDIIGSALVAVSALSLIAGFSSVLLLAVMGALFGVLNALWWPAMSGVLPEILPKEKLQEGNAIIGLMSNIGVVFGTLLGGVIVTLTSPGWALLIDGATFFIAGLIVWNLKLDAKSRVESPGIIHDLRIGWREFISRSWLVTMVIAFAFINMAFDSMITILGPLNFSDPETGPRNWSYNLAGLTIGMMIGGVIVLKFKFKHPLFVSMILVAISGIWDFALAFDLSLAVSIAAGIFSGIAVEIFLVTWSTSMQTHIPEESFSRVNAYDSLGSYGFAPLGIIIAGPLAEAFSVNSILFATGSITLLASAVALSVKSVRTLSNE